MNGRLSVAVMPNAQMARHGYTVVLPTRTIVGAVDDLGLVRQFRIAADDGVEHRGGSGVGCFRARNAQLALPIQAGKYGLGVRGFLIRVGVVEVQPVWRFVLGGSTRTGWTPPHRGGHE
jgi:hypothetical protein